MANRSTQPKVALIDRPKSKPRKGASEETVYASIYDAVMDHRLPPGIKLTESAFSDFFGVSRTVIRKALFRLSQQNIVELRPNRGAVVASPTPDETRAVFDARRLIEQDLVAHAAKSATKKQVNDLKTLANRENTAKQKNDHRALVRLSGDFHVLIAEFAGNPVLTDFLRSLVSRTSLIIALYEAPGVPMCSNHDHWELIEKIETRDSEAASRAMIEHLTEIEDRLDLTARKGPLDLKQVFGGA